MVLAEDSPEACPICCGKCMHAVVAEDTALVACAALLEYRRADHPGGCDYYAPAVTAGTGS